MQEGGADSADDRGREAVSEAGEQGRGRGESQGARENLGPPAMPPSYLSTALQKSQKTIFLTANKKS